MRKGLVGFIIGVVVSLAAAAGGGYYIITNGIIPAAANGKPIPLEHWAARSSLRATLQSLAPKGPNPVELTDANLIAGIELYSRHCSICHGTAKGNSATSPLAAGEYPEPPQLASEGVEDDPEGWDVWKIENGIRWTGMPSWKGVLSERDAWTLALFLKHMNELPPAAAADWQQVGNTPSH